VETITLENFFMHRNRNRSLSDPFAKNQVLDYFDSILKN